MTPLMSALVLLAEAPDNTGPDFGKASPIGLLVVILLLICLFFLLRSMNRHLKKVPERFDDQVEQDPADRDADEAGAQDSPREPSG
ncbi:MAG: hypothetical protein EBU23_12840 [Mycobacteriaceae bacterium]|nr:hypothetical protein [Mycobacteriaceae bacterium]NBQ43336.1 hypothetical protein [Mycobacteriaceae bacterium]